MTELLTELWAPFTYQYMAKAMWVSALVGAVCAFLSAYLMLKGWSLMGDALAHSIVPGVAGAYLLGVPFAVGAFFAGLGFLSGFWLPSFRATASAKVVAEADEMASSSKECERMLMAEMTTIDAENEPAAIEPKPKADAKRRG